jgi:hypothetical protein
MARALALAYRTSDGPFVNGEVSDTACTVCFSVDGSREHEVVKMFASSTETPLIRSDAGHLPPVKEARRKCLLPASISSKQNPLNADRPIVSAVPSAEMPFDLAFFVDLESRVWQALAQGDAEADAHLLDPQFVGIYPSGFASRDDHVAQLNNGPSVDRFSIHEPRLLWLAPDTVLLAYRASFTRPLGATASAPQTLFISSVWKRRGDDWVNIFSQDTPVGEASKGVA